MDEIISGFEKLNVSVNDNDLCDLIGKWNLKDHELESNYSKLKYFKSIYNKIDDKNYDLIFKRPFILFMEKLDQLNYIYLEVLDFNSDFYIKNNNIYDVSSVKDIVNISSSFLNKAIESENPSKKLDYNLIAYSNIIMLFNDFDYHHISKKRKRV